MAVDRVWHGWTTPGNAALYEELVTETVLPSHEELPGYLGSQLLRRDVGEEVEFLVITGWESYDAIRGFAGDDYDRATIPPEAEKLLARFDPRAIHYERRCPPKPATATGAGG